jgi:hypothetical protein
MLIFSLCVVKRPPGDAGGQVRAAIQRQVDGSAQRGERDNDVVLGVGQQSMAQLAISPRPQPDATSSGSRLIAAAMSSSVAP